MALNTISHVEKGTETSNSGVVTVEVRKALLLVALIIAAGLVVWWINSPWFKSSESLEISGSHVNAVVSDPSQRVYFGVPIVNTTDQTLTIESVKFPKLNNRFVETTVIPLSQDPNFGVESTGSDEVRIGTADLETLETEYANQWARRQDPRGIKLQAGEEVTLLIGIGVSEETQWNSVNGLDVQFTDGRFHGTTTARLDFRVDLEP